MLLHRPARGALILASVAAMFLLGLMMQGALFSPQRGDLLTMVIYCGGFLGIVTKRTDRERVRYAVYCFMCFIGAIFGLSWLMYLGHG